MKVAVLSGGEGWHVQDLQRAGALREHPVEAIDFRSLSASTFEPFPLAGFDAIVVLAMPPGSLEQVVFRMDILLRLQANGTTILNPPRALELCIDKYLATAALQAAGLSVPPTFVCQDSETALEAFERMGRDVVVKPVFGSEGRGMMRISDPDLAWRAFRALERSQSVLYLQQFIPHYGHDLRLFLLEDRLLTAMRRHSETWRTNVAQGGKGEVYDPSTSEIQMAMQAAQALQVPIAGVDLLPARNGTTYVLEVNAVPGWRKLSQVTGIDVAREILDFVSHQALRKMR